MPHRDESMWMLRPVSEVILVTGLEIHFIGGSKLLPPGARPGSKTNFVVEKLYVHFFTQSKYTDI